jgi:hypothetical protein
MHNFAFLAEMSDRTDGAGIIKNQWELAEVFLPRDGKR